MELCSESDAGNVLSALTSSLQRLTAFQNAGAERAVNLLTSAQIQVEEAIGELNRFVDHFDADPERQQMLEERLDTITPWRASTAYNRANCPTCTSSCWKNWKASMPMTKRSSASAKSWPPTLATTRKAGELSRNRQAAAEQLASAVEAEIQRWACPAGASAYSSSRQQKASTCLRPGTGGVPGQRQPSASHARWPRSRRAASCHGSAWRSR